MTTNWQRTGVYHQEGRDVFAQEVEQGTRDYHERWTLLESGAERNDALAHLSAEANPHI